MDEAVVYNLDLIVGWLRAMVIVQAVAVGAFVVSLIRKGP